MRTRTLLMAVLIAVSGLLVPACGRSRTSLLTPPATLVQAAAGAALPRGPDAIGGTGDFVLSNGFLRAVVDLAGVDATSVGGTFSLANGMAPSGGTLVDLTTAGGLNDQWNQMLQGVVGTVIPASGTVGSADASNGTFEDLTVNFTTAGVVSGDALRILSGLNAGRSYRVGLVTGPNTLLLFVPPGVPYQTEGVPGPGAISYEVVRQTKPLENVIEYTQSTIVSASGETRLRVGGRIVNRGTVPLGCGEDPVTHRLLSGPGGPELTVETDYILSDSSEALGVETRVTNPGAGAVSLIAVTDIVQAGGLTDANVLPWSPLRGFQAQGLNAASTVPFASFRGRDEPGASYTIVDPRKGQLIFATDGMSLAFAQQVPPGAAVAAGGTLSWLRHVSVGDRNDVASSADVAVRLLGLSTERTDTVTGGTNPNGFRNVATLSGQVLGATPGTRVTAIQVSPALTFDPGPPQGLMPAAGFISTSVLGLSELRLTEAALDAQGRFSMMVPFAFAGRSPTATLPPANDLQYPPGFENGTASATYRLVVEAPGHDPQNLVVNTASNSPLQFDLRGETGIIDLVVTDELGNPIPARVIIVGMDPDGGGPATATPDPILGGSTLVTTEPRATGDGNVVHLLDGRGSVEVPPGAYQVIATRGLEYTVDRFPAAGAATSFFLISAGQTVRTETTGVPMRLRRVLDSAVLPDPGGGTFVSPLRRHVASDLHVHTGSSYNNPIPYEDRVLSYLTAGIEVLVTADHDNLTDLGPALAALDGRTTLNLSQMMATQVGGESTGSVPVDVAGVLELPNTAGHSSAWPLPRVADQRRKGAPQDEFRTPAHHIEQFRTMNARVVQLNHPRFPIQAPPLWPIGAGFFTNGKAGYAQGNTGVGSLTAGGYARPLRSTNPGPVGNDGSLDDLNVIRTPGNSRHNSFDAMEVFDGNLPLYDDNRFDWYAMLSAGYVRTATASSGWRGLRGAPGSLRTYVFAPGNGSADLSAVNLAALDAALLPRLVQGTPGTTAPLIAQSFPAAVRVGSAADDMEVLCSSGPIVYLEISTDGGATYTGQPGDFVGQGPTLMVADVRVTILAAPWVPVTSAAILVNGGGSSTSLGIGGSTTNITGNLAPNPADPFSTSLGNVVRLRQTYSITLPSGVGQDHWLTVEVRGASTAGSVYHQLVPDPTGGVPTGIGFTNPIFIDTNGDGEWDPNGVP